MPNRLIVVTIAFDPEAEVWYVEDSGDLPGANAWGRTPQELTAKLEDVVLDLLEEEGADDGDLDVPIEIIAHMRTRARRGVGV
jgi:hypothetical protein